MACVWLQTIQETERAKSRLLDGVDDDEGVEDEDTEDDLPAPRRKKRNYDETTSLRSSRYSTGSGVVSHATAAIHPFTHSWFDRVR